MPLNKQSGNMYSFVTHTWNPIKGKCVHACSYCYMRKWGEPHDLRLDEKDLKTDLGEKNFIFVGSGTDMFEPSVSSDWIMQVLEKCMDYSGNRYLFQSKDPYEFQPFLELDMINCILATTLETNRETALSKAPQTADRAKVIAALHVCGFKTMITVEPIVDFDLYQFVEMIKECRPEWVNIGADSQGHNLPEPTPEKIGLLIDMLSEFTEVKIKKTLNRIYKVSNA